MNLQLDVINRSQGAFTTTDILTRDVIFHHFKRKEYKNTYYIQDTEEIQEYVQGTQDGIYYLTVLNSSVSPTVSPFTGEKFTQPLNIFILKLIVTILLLIQNQQDHMHSQKPLVKQRK